MAKAANLGAQIEVSNVMFLAGRGAVNVGHVHAGAARVADYLFAALKDRVR